MASITDVENALQALIATIFYPNAAPPSVLGYPVKIYAGWPDPATLDADMVETAPGVPTAAHVSIYPLPAERNVTRYARDAKEAPKPAATYTLTAAGQVITVGGAAPNPYSPQNLAAFVNGKAYVATATAGQTPAQVASALRALIAVDVPGTTVVGAAITLPAGARIGSLRVGVTGSVSAEVRRQEKQIAIIDWSSSPAGREALASLHEPVLADTDFLAMPDGTRARLIYRGSREDDFAQKQRTYRRFHTYTVEYATTRVTPATEVVVGVQNLEDAQGNLIVSGTA